MEDRSLSNPTRWSIVRAMPEKKRHSTRPITYVLTIIGFFFTTVTPRLIRAPDLIEREVREKEREREFGGSQVVYLLSSLEAIFSRFLRRNHLE
jgi:hypothetical protein